MTSRHRRKSVTPEPLVKVTLQSLKGISWKPPPLRKSREPCSDFSTDSERRMPYVTAAISFSGSATNMQVCSSCVCARTGNLLVESQPVIAWSPSPQNHQQQRDTLYPSNQPLVANFDTQDEPGTIKKPHLTIRLPSRDANVPNVTLESVNRDCKVHAPQQNRANSNGLPSLDESDLSSNTREANDAVVRNEGMGPTRGESMVWSASGTAMPEIIELNVCLQVDDSTIDESTEGSGSFPESQDAQSPASRKSLRSKPLDQNIQEGIAYLVFFGHDMGTTTMDLPIKRLSNKKSAADASEGVVLEEDAYVRITVDVFPSGKDEKQAAAEAVYSKSLVEIQSFFEKKRFEPILQQLRKETDRRVEKVRERAAQKGDEEVPSSRGFACGGAGMSFTGFLKDLGFVIKGCNAGGYHVSEDDDSIASTLDTSPSMNL